MKTVLIDTPVAYAPPAPVADAPGSPVRARWLDFLELTKPRIGLMVLFTVAIGALLTAPAALDLVQLLHALIGTALVASGASALNQWMERRSDAQMRRTENRPLPAGRLTSAEVLIFGYALVLGGLAYMAIVMTHPLSVGITAATFLSYVFIYTPLKRKTTLNTLVGAVPGALPPVIGWTAMTGTLDTPALVLFLIVFIWQVPHFLAIAWMHREDYARAGLQMLPVIDGDGSATARQMMLYTLALIPISLLPVLFGGASMMYGFGALGIGVFFLRSVWFFVLAPTNAQARKVLHASLIYLPAVLALLLMERVIRVFLV
ncbi:MAG: protoheme IX farnesyltransferase [Planctomycetes bacterium]|nr:protoheme IX farnesyltransferase [Planctomycetota bacterium]